jgi:hypothetical protein
MSLLVEAIIQSAASSVKCFSMVVQFLIPMESDGIANHEQIYHK